jgi:hypothetical protein
MENIQNMDCSVCKNKFDEENHLPLTLPCSHPICKSCISKIKPGDKVICPFCGSDFSNINLNDLKPHQMILSIIRDENNNENYENNDNNNNNISEENSDENSYNSSGNEGQTETNNENSNMNSNSENMNDNINNNNSNKNNNIMPQPNQELCNIHKEKLIEFFCQTCSKAICSYCIFEKHNGHHLTLLEDMSNIIKNNVKDFGKILKNLEKINEDNQITYDNKIEDVENKKNNQINMVNKSFEEIIKKIEEKKMNIIDEYENKYKHESKRFKRIKDALLNNQNQIERIGKINDTLTKNFQTFSDAKILKKIDEFTSFLHKSAFDIKKLYKMEISLKAELIIDPAMKPLPINIKDLLNLLDGIDPKNICYPVDESVETETSQNNSNNNNNKNKNLVINQDFDNELNSYINRINPENSSFNSEYTSDGTGKYYKIPKRKNDKKKNNKQNKENEMNEIKLKLRNNSANNRIFPKLEDKRNIYYKDRNKYENGMSDSYTDSISNSINQIQQSAMNAHNLINNIENKKLKLKHRIPSALNRRINNNQSDVYLPQIKNNNLSNNNINILQNRDFNPNNNEVAIYCFGEAEYALKFYINYLKWELIQYTTEKSHLLGSVRYSSIVSIPGQRMILTGGCKTINDDPTNLTFEINSNNINDVNILKSMNIKRYGHSSIYLNHYIYVIGGYDHIDNSQTSILSTLKSCERFDIRKNKWEHICNLNHPRAFTSSTVIKNNIFIFGGMYNEKILSSIEKYDIYNNTWITYHIKLPEKLAKTGLINFNNEILILGGITENYNVSNKVYSIKIDGKNNEWKFDSEMICRRATSASSFYWDGFIYVLGGSSEGICEKYDLSTGKWEIFESYFSSIREYKIDGTIKNFCCCLNYFVMSNQ